MFSGTMEALFFLSVLKIDVKNPDIDNILQKKIFQPADNG